MSWCSPSNWMAQLKKPQQWWVSVARQLRAWPVAQCWSSSQPPSADGKLGWVAQVHKTLSCLYNLLYINFKPLALRRHINREVSTPMCIWVTNNLVVLLVKQNFPAFYGTWRSIGHVIWSVDGDNDSEDSCIQECGALSPYRKQLGEICCLHLRDGIEDKSSRFLRNVCTFLAE